MADPPPFSLSLDPDGPDQSVKPGMSGFNYKTSRDKFLRLDGGSGFLHTNPVASMRDSRGKNISEGYRLQRSRRLWTVRSDRPAEVGSGQLELDWSDDSMNTTGGWCDGPGMAINASPASAGAQMVHQAQEFFIWVIFGEVPTASMGLYHFQIVSAGMGRYRAQHSEGKPMSFKDWTNKRGQRVPWIAEFGARIVADSGWRVFG